MLELAVPGFAYSAIKDLWAFVRGRRRRLTPAQVIQLRQKWKSEIGGKLYDRKSKKLRSDIIIRDMRRIDNYPNVDEKSRGISAWFKVGLMGTYHRGFIAGLSWESAIIDHKTGREVWTAKDHGGKNAILAGYIPFESIETIDWDGDEFYGHPIFYCYFEGLKSQPYEEIAYCEEGDLDGQKFYTKIAPYVPPPRSYRTKRS